MNTIEGAIVLSALVLTSGVMVGGIVAVAQHSSAASLARDAARAEAIGHDGARLVASRDSTAQVSINSTTVGGVESVQVEVTKPTSLFDVTASAVTMKEPEDPER